MAHNVAHPPAHPGRAAAPPPEEEDADASGPIAVLERCGLDVRATPLVALYFSAAWCGPCKQFTPVLTQFHAACKSTPDLANTFRPVFVSFDQHAQQFEEYFAKMTWEAISFEREEERNELADLLKVGGIPCLVVLDTRHNKVISCNARADVQQFATAPQHLVRRWLQKFGVKRSPE